jgi:hypothetical protein
VKTGCKTYFFSSLVIDAYECLHADPEEDPDEREPTAAGPEFSELAWLTKGELCAALIGASETEGQAAAAGGDAAHLSKYLDSLLD